MTLGWRAVARQHGIFAQEPDGDFDSWTEEGIAEDEQFYRKINETAPGCQIHPHVITSHGIQEFDWRYWPLPAGQFCDSDAFLDERVDADGSTYNVIYQAVLHEWRQRTRDMHMRGVFKVRPGSVTPCPGTWEPLGTREISRLGNPLETWEH